MVYICDMCGSPMIPWNVAEKYVHKQPKWAGKEAGKKSTFVGVTHGHKCPVCGNFVGLYGEPWKVKKGR